LESYKVFTVSIEREWLSAIINFPVSEVRNKIPYYGSVLLLTPCFKQISAVLKSISFGNIKTKLNKTDSFDAGDIIIGSYEKREKLKKLSKRYVDVPYVSLGFVVDILSQLGKDKPLIPDKDIYSHHLSQMYDIANERQVREEKEREKEQEKIARHEETDSVVDEMNQSQRL